MIWSRENTRRGWLARNHSRSNSLAVSLTSASPLRTSRAAASKTRSPVSSLSTGGAAGPERRSTDLTLATSSRGENGLVT